MANEQKDIRTLAKRYDKLQTLMQYVNKEALMKEHQKQDSKKASGVDKVTKEEYGQDLEGNINRLLERMKTFSYRPQPVKRVYIPKPGSETKRPLGIPAYEDKLVQGCVAYVLNEIYETKFLDCSYGFREQRSAHMAIEVMNHHIMRDKVNYILEVDIKGFFDNLDQTWLIKFLEHHIEDKNFMRYIVRFLKSGVMSGMERMESDKGTSQGGLISPVLANVYLHYVLDLWFRHIKEEFKGEMYLVRYADDFIILCQYESEASQCYQMLKARLAKFNLEINEEKTRVIPFGRFKGNGDKFDFLGFEFHNGKTNKGTFRTEIITSRKKLKTKRAIVKSWILEHMDTPLSETMTSLNRKMEGHYNYYGINGNLSSLIKFTNYVKHTLYKALNRRSQRKSMTYEIFYRIWNHYMKVPRIKKDIWKWQSV